MMKCFQTLLSISTFAATLWEANFHKQQLVTAQQVNARSAGA
jgi:hypothetical protein